MHCYVNVFGREDDGILLLFSLIKFPNFRLINLVLLLE